METTTTTADFRSSLLKTTLKMIRSIKVYVETEIYKAKRGLSLREHRLTKQAQISSQISTNKQNDTQ